MQNLFVPYPLAKLLKEKGFDEPCLMVYYGEGTGLAETGQPMDKLYLPSGFGKMQNSHLRNLPKMEIYLKGQVTAPLYQQVIDWFRDKQQIKIFESQYFSDLGVIWYVKQYQDSVKFYGIEKAFTHALTLI